MENLKFDFEKVFIEYVSLNGAKLSFNGSYHICPDASTEFIFEFDHYGEGRVWFPVVIDHQQCYKPLAENEIMFYGLFKVNLVKRKRLMDFIRKYNSENIKAAINKDEDCFFIYTIPVNKETINTVEKISAFFDKLKSDLDNLSSAVCEFEKLDRLEGKENINGANN